MKVQIDGQFVEVQNGITIIYENVVLGMGDQKCSHCGASQEVLGEVHLTIKDEGVIIDKVEFDDNQDSVVNESSSLDVQDLHDLCH